VISAVRPANIAIRSMRCVNGDVTEKLEWCGYPMVKIFEDMPMFIRFDMIHERDRQTDGHTDRQTPHDGIGRAYA